MSPRIRRGLVWAHVIAAGLLGSLGFGLQPSAIFPAADGEALGALALRLAAYGNGSGALLAAWLLLRRSYDIGLVRALAGAGLVYHVAAGIDGARLATGAVDVQLAGPIHGPLVFHCALALTLAAAAAWPGRSARPA